MARPFGVALVGGVEEEAGGADAVGGENDDFGLLFLEDAGLVVVAGAIGEAVVADGDLFDPAAGAELDAFALGDGQ